MERFVTTIENTVLSYSNESQYKTTAYILHSDMTAEEFKKVIDKCGGLYMSPKKVGLFKNKIEITLHDSMYNMGTGNVFKNYTWTFSGDHPDSLITQISEQLYVDTGCNNSFFNKSCSGKYVTKVLYWK